MVTYCLVLPVKSKAGAGPSKRAGSVCACACLGLRASTKGGCSFEVCGREVVQDHACLLGMRAGIGCLG